MTFTLTQAHIASLLDPVSQSSDWAPFVAAIDPDVRWVIASETKDPTRLTGVYNLASWIQDVSQPILARVKNGVKMTVSSAEIIGNKAIIEAYGEATQANGRPYNNRYAWFMTFSSETGKIVEIREYLNSALVQEVLETN